MVKPLGKTWREEVRAFFLVGGGRKEGVFKGILGFFLSWLLS